MHNATQALKVAQQHASGDTNEGGGSKNVWAFLAKKTIKVGVGEKAQDEAKQEEQQTKLMAEGGEVRAHSQSRCISTTVVLVSLTVYHTAADSETGHAGHSVSLVR